MPLPHIVLVHGAWHRAWHVHLLKAQLESSGYPVSDIDLPSCGENAPATGALEADTEALRELIETVATEADSILPVFHSYGGMPGQVAVAELSASAKSRIQRLVFLASFARLEGTTQASDNWPRADWVTVEGPYCVVEDPTAIFYHDVEPDLAKEAAARLSKFPVGAFFTPVNHAGWQEFPSTFILCKDDRAVPLERNQRWFAGLSDEDRTHWEFVTIDGGHSPFLADPVGCAKVLRRIAGEKVD